LLRPTGRMHLNQGVFDRLLSHAPTAIITPALRQFPPKTLSGT
jgi:hypothetical protein